jgi:hypothetical protein
LPNHPPRITNTTVPDAWTDTPYVSGIQAVDDDGDVLHYSLVTSVMGMTVDSLTGRISWTPKQVGVFPVSVAVWDGKDKTTFDFNITVRRLNHPPRFTGTPLLNATVDSPYLYRTAAVDADNDTLSFWIQQGPPGMLVDNATGNVSWMPSSVGNISVSIMVSDGFGGDAYQEFNITVSPAVRPRITILSPSFDNKWSGKVTVKGTIKKGTRDVLELRYKVDSGDWKRADGIYGWNFDIDTTSLWNGEHTLYLKADEGNNINETLVKTFEVGNNPAIEPVNAILLVAILVIALVAAGIVAFSSLKKRHRKAKGTKGAVKGSGKRDGGKDDRSRT